MRFASQAPVFAVARNTFSEIVRQPAFAIVVVATLLFFAIAPAFSMFSLGEESNVVKDFGLSTLLLSGLVLTCLGAGNVVRRELDDRTTLVLFAKPLSRELFVVAKYAGLVMALAVAVAVFLAALVLAARSGADFHEHHHGDDGGGGHVDLPVRVGGPGAFALALGIAVLRSYRSGRSFCGGLVVGLVPCFAAGVLLAWLVSPDGRFGELGVGLDGFLVRGAALIFLAAAVLASFAVSAALWLGRGGTFLLTTLFFLAGLGTEQLAVLPGFLTVLLPDFQLFWVGELAYVPDVDLRWGYVLRSAFHAAGFVFAFLGIGALSLRHKSL